MVKTVIFDVGGVLAYDVWEHLLLDKFNGVASKYNLNEQLVKKTGEDLWDKFAYKSENSAQDPWTEEEEYWTEFIKRTKVDAKESDFIKMTDKFIRPTESFRDIEQILNWLKEKNICLAILSNNTEFWYKRQKKELKLGRFFSDKSKVILSCRFGKSKRDLLENDDSFRDIILKRLGCKPEECIFVDDREDNIKAGRKRGFIGIQIKGVASHIKSNLSVNSAFCP